jgi:hypothetical protein
MTVRDHRREKAPALQISSRGLSSYPGFLCKRGTTIITEHPRPRTFCLGQPRKEQLLGFFHAAELMVYHASRRTVRNVDQVKRLLVITRHEGLKAG